MDQIDYKDTQLWADSKALALEVYRVTESWGPEAKELVQEIRGVLRSIIRGVPGAFKKAGLAGNIHLEMNRGHFAELALLLELAETLGYAETGSTRPALEAVAPVEAKFRELSRAAKDRARELMRQRTVPFGLDDDDDDHF